MHEWSSRGRVKSKQEDCATFVANRKSICLRLFHVRTANRALAPATYANQAASHSQISTGQVCNGHCQWPLQKGLHTWL